MSDNSQSLRNPESITTLNELEVAKRKAEINANHDRLLLTNNLTALRNQGPSVVLKNIVLPVVGVGIAIWGVSKIVGSLTSPDERSYYVEPYDEEIDHGRSRSKRSVKSRRRETQVDSLQKNSNTHNLSGLTKFAPAALMIAKMGVGYWEKSGRRVPQFLHDLVSGPGVSSSQNK